MKHLILIISILAITNSFYAQEITEKWGSEGQRIIGVDASGNIISVDNASVRKLQGKRGFGSMSIDYYEAKREDIYDNCVATPHHVYFPFLVFPSGDKKDLSVVEVDAKGKIKGSVKMVTEADFNKKAMRQDVNYDKEGLLMSENKQLLLKLSATGFMKTKDNAKMSITVLDESMKTLWHKTQDFTYADKDLDIEDALITNSGKVVLFGWVHKPKVDKKSLGPFVDYKTFVITKDGTKEGTFYDENERLSESFKVVGDNGDKVLISGFYQNKSIQKRKGLLTVDGSYAVKFDLSTCSVEAKEFFPFDAETIKGMEDRTHKVNQNNTSDIPTVCVLNNGAAGFTLVAQRTSSGVAYTGGGYNGPQVSQYGAFQKLLIGYDTQLKKKFETVITCDFTTGVPNAIGLDAFAIGDKMLLLYSEGHTGAKENDHIATLLDASGKVVAKRTLEPQKTGYELRPELTWQLDDKSVVISFNKNDFPSYKYSDTQLKEAVITVK